MPLVSVSPGLQGLFAECVNELMLYSVFPQGHALVMPLLIQPRRRCGRYCSKGPGSHSVGAKFNGPDGHLEAVPRCTKAPPRDRDDGGFTSQCLANVISYLLHIPIELSSADGLSKRSHLAPRPPKINRRVLLWLVANINQIYHRGEGATWECIQSISDFPSTTEGCIPGAGRLLPKPNPSLSPDSLATLGKLFRRPESLLSYPQHEDNKSTHL